MSVDVKFMENYCEGWRLKERGNEAYRSGDRKRAAANYGRVFLYVNALAPDDRACEPDGYRYPDDVKLPAGALPLARRVLELRRDAYTSLALCHFLNADHDKAITCATNALEQDKEHIKAKVHRGRAHLGKRDLERALADLKEAATAQPQDRGVRLWLAQCEAAITDEKRATEAALRERFDGVLNRSHPHAAVEKDPRSPQCDSECKHEAKAHEETHSDAPAPSAAEPGLNQHGVDEVRRVLGELPRRAEALPADFP